MGGLHKYQEKKQRSFISLQSERGTGSLEMSLGSERVGKWLKATQLLVGAQDIVCADRRLPFPQSNMDRERFQHLYLLTSQHPV